MAISFEESVNKIAGQPMRMAVRTMSLSNNASTSDIEDTFILNEKYKWYNNSYNDDKISRVDENKNIVVNNDQVCVMQENNSQYLPFELNRYYDGVDLNDMTFSIHYVNSNREEGASLPINFYYSDTKIRFGWLLDDNVTQFDGDVLFEIVANGYNEKEEKYLWRTKPNGRITILKSLIGNGSVSQNTDWYLQFLEDVDAKVEEASDYADAAAASAIKAEYAIINSDLIQDAIDIHNEENDAHQDIRDIVQEKAIEWGQF